MCRWLMYFSVSPEEGDLYTRETKEIVRILSSTLERPIPI